MCISWICKDKTLFVSHYKSMVSNGSWAIAVIILRNKNAINVGLEN